MPFVSAAQLTALRNIAYRGLDTPFELWRSTQVESDYGSSTSWGLVTSGKCWLRMMNKPHTVEQLGMIEGATAIYRMHTDVSVIINNGDRVRINDIDYEVNDVNDDDTIQVFRTALLRRIQ
jgi:hypothetical protein